MTPSALHLSHFFSLLFLGPALCAAVPQSTPQTIRAYIGAHYPDVNKARAQDFVASARLNGLITNTADLLLAKRVFADLRKSKVAGRGALRFDIERLVDGESAAAGSELGFMPLTDGIERTEEREYNNSASYADSLGDSSFVTGDIDVNGDIDYFTVAVPATGLVIASVLPRGGDPLADARLLIQNESGGFVAFNDDANGSLFPTICAILPAGVYHFVVDIFPGSQLGDYTMNILRFPQPALSLTLGAVTTGTISNLFGQLFEFTLPQDSHVDMQFAGGPLDLRMTLLRADNGILFFVDDSSAGLDPNFESNLPAGKYFITVDEFSGLTGNYSFQVDAVPSSPAVLPGGAVVGSIAGPESFPLYSLDLAFPAKLSLTTSPAAVDPIDDTVVDLFDANLQLIASNDDTVPSRFSTLDTYLPQGRYYVGVRGFVASRGGFNLSAGIAPLAAALNARFTNNVTTLASGDEALFSVEINTPNPIEVLLRDNGSHPDPRVTMVDASGHRVLLNERGPLGESGDGSELLDRGTYMVTVRSESNAGSGDFGIEVRPPLWVDEITPGVCRGFGHHKEGAPVIVLVGPREGPPRVLFPGLLDGFSLLSSINDGVQSLVTPLGGQYSWRDVPFVTCTVQGLNFDFLGAVEFGGRWTDVINIVNGVIN